MTPMELRAIGFVEKNYPVPMRKRHWETLAAEFEQVRAEGELDGRVEGLKDACNLVQHSGKIPDEVKRAFHLLVEARIVCLRTGVSAVEAINSVTLTQGSAEGSPKG